MGQDETTLDLLGQYLASRPEFVQHYYYIIVSRLTDPGVSVRKRVVKILRDVCVSRDAPGVTLPPSSSQLASPTSPAKAMNAAERAIDTCCRLAARLGPSEEEEVHKLILRTFHDVWFATPEAGSGQGGGESGDVLSDGECTARCDMLIGVLSKTASSSPGASGAQRCEWLGSLLRARSPA